MPIFAFPLDHLSGVDRRADSYILTVEDVHAVTRELVGYLTEHLLDLVADLDDVTDLLNARKQNGNRVFADAIAIASIHILQGDRDAAVTFLE